MKEGRFDFFYFGLVVALMCAGVVIVYSISFVYAHEKFNDPTFFMKRQMIYMGISYAVLLGAAFFPLKLFRRMTFPFLFSVVLLLILVFVPGVGHKIKGVHRWIHLGYFNIQPSEFAKLAVVMYLADFTARKAEHLSDWKKGFLPPVAVIAFICTLVVIEPDFGGAATLFVIGLLTLYIGGSKLLHNAMLFLVTLPLAVLLVFLEPYRMQRVLSFLDPWRFFSGPGFQTVQSFLALGSGGLIGVGLGNSRQKLFYLPEAHTDFVLAVVGEELGFAGFTGALLAVLMLSYLGYRTAWKAKTHYEKVLAGGMTTIILLQALLNACVVLGLLPPKGMPFPFLSYGGSFLLVCALACGLVLNVSRRVQE